MEERKIVYPIDFQNKRTVGLGRVLYVNFPDFADLNGKRFLIAIRLLAEKYPSDR
jgi:hypothetical protein